MQALTDLTAPTSPRPVRRGKGMDGRCTLPAARPGSSVEPGHRRPTCSSTGATQSSFPSARAAGRSQSSWPGQLPDQGRGGRTDRMAGGGGSSNWSPLTCRARPCSWSARVLCNRWSTSLLRRPPPPREPLPGPLPSRHPGPSRRCGPRLASSPRRSRHASICLHDPVPDELPDTQAITGLLGIIVDNGNLDHAKATAWGFVRTIDYWLWGLENGFTVDPARCQRIGSALAPLAGHASQP